MPTYEYECTACEHKFEEEQRMSDPRIETCPKCGKNSVKKIISVSSFQLAGQGWSSDSYSTPKKKTT